MQDMQLNSKHWIFLSPHLDDAVLSCGGLIWELVQRGCQVEIWTLFAGDKLDGAITPFAQELHARWGTAWNHAAEQRRREDRAACSILEAGYRHFSFADCIYRRETGLGRAVVVREEDLFQPNYAGEEALRRQLLAALTTALPSAAVIASPFGVGRHIDHQITAAVLRRVRCEVWYYLDYPYAQSQSGERRLWQEASGESFLLPVSARGLAHWQEAGAAYRSQVSTFWSNLEALRNAIRTFWCWGGGSLLRRLDACSRKDCAAS